MEETCIYSKHSKKQESLVAISTPNKMGLSLHCHVEHKLKKWNAEEDEDTRRKKRFLWQALIDLQALQRVFFVLKTFQDI